MWQQYRKTLIPTQLLVIAFCGVLAYRGAPIQGIALVAVVMEVAAVFGAMWAVRLKRKVLGSNKDDLPLRPR
jgi:hypothetical protein